MTVEGVAHCCPSDPPLTPYNSLISKRPMKVKSIGSNQTEVSLADGTEVLFSYETPVAALVPGKGWLRTAKKWSATTTKHTNAWLRKNCGGTVQDVPQWELDQLVAF